MPVPARKELHAPLQLGRPNAKLIDNLLNFLALTAGAQQAEAREGWKIERGHRRVFAHRARHREPFRHSVGREVANALLQHTGGLRSRDPLARDPNFSGSHLFQAEHRPGELRLAASDQARDAHDFAGAHRKTDVHQTTVGGAQIFDLEHHIRWLVLDLRKENIDLATCHHFDQVGLLDTIGVYRADFATVSQHSHTIAYLLDLSHTMRDVYDSDTLAFKARDQGKEFLRFLLGK